MFPPPRGLFWELRLTRPVWVRCPLYLNHTLPYLSRVSVTSGGTEPESLLFFLELAGMSLSPRHCWLYWSSLTFIHQLVHMDCFKRNPFPYASFWKQKLFFLPVNSPLYCGSRSHTQGLPTPAFQERAFDDKIMKRRFHTLYVLLKVLKTARIFWVTYKCVRHKQKGTCGITLGWKCVWRKIMQFHENMC